MIEQVEPAPEPKEAPKSSWRGPRSERRTPPPRHEGALRSTRSSKEAARKAEIDRRLKLVLGRIEQAKADRVATGRRLAAVLGKGDEREITRTQARRREEDERLRTLELERDALLEAQESTGARLERLLAEDAANADALAELTRRADEAFPALAPALQAVLDVLGEIQAVRSDGLPLLGRQHPLQADYHFLGGLQEAIRRLAEPVLNCPQITEEWWRGPAS